MTASQISQDASHADDVKRTINFYVGGNGVPLEQTSGNPQNLTNIDVAKMIADVSHTNIDDNRNLHRISFLATLDAIAAAPDDTFDP